MKKIGWKQILLGLAFAASLAVAGIFVYRTVRPIIYWRLHRDEPIQGWMTVGYVAHSYHVPPHVLYQALGLPLRPRDRRPLREIAKEQGKTMDQMRAVLMNAIVHARPPYPEPSPPPPPPPDAELSP
jgi:hypothetical protein